MRLDYFIATSSGYTRKQAKRLIGTGHVQVEGLPGVRLKPNTAVTDTSEVYVDGERVLFRREHYYMLHKPAGLVCSTDDPDHPTVMSLLPPALRPGLHIAGRLDLDTTGLVLLTTDGQWSHRVTSPNFECAKRYRVTLADAATAAQLAQLRDGVKLKSDTRKTRPAKVEPVSETVLRLTISEGRYHQVKRMLAAVGNQVVALHREAVGGITLPDALAPGAYRVLTEDEIQAI